MNQRTENFLLHSFLISAFIISLYSFIVTPFSGDLFVLFAGSHQADMLGGNIISNAFMQWDLKGAFYRLALYIIYRCINPFVNLIGTGTNFCIAVNAFFCACVIAAITFSVIIARGIKEGRKNLFAILALCTAIFASFQHTHMQAEMICAVNLIPAFSVYINAQRTKHFFRTKLFISGFIAAGIVFFKTIFGLMALPFAAGIYLYNRKNNFTLAFKDFMFIAAGGLLMLLCASALILYINPREMQNILDAAIWQHTLINGEGKIIDALRNFAMFGAYAALIIPAILCGIVCGAFNLLDDIRRGSYEGVSLRLLLWLGSFSVIVIANCYFIYHYFILVPACLLEIYLADKKRKIIKRSAAFALAVSAVFYLCFVSPFSMHTSESRKFTEETYNESRKIISALNISPSESIMYLDDGIGAYLIGNKSWLDEYYPLPLQRVREDAEYPSHVNALNKALDFRERYVAVNDSWFFKEGNNQRIKDKLNREYRKRCSLSMYTSTLNVFRSPSEKKLHRVIDIYERIMP